MNQITEKLINEDGQYKIRQLSDYKIFIKYDIPIFCSDGNSMVIIDTLKIKIRYRINKNERRSSNELPVYYLIPIKNGFFNFISRKWKIKKENIFLQKNTKLILVNGYLLNNIHTGIIFEDKSWYRDYTIKQILNEN